MFVKTNNLKLPFYLKLITRFTFGVALLTIFLGYNPQTNPLPFTPTEVRAEAPQIISTASPITFVLPHIGYISTYYSQYHPGIDIAAGLGLPVHAVADGTVSFQGYNFFGLGLSVEIQHPYGYKSTYGHLGKTYVKAGNTVKQGDIIGEVGMTGHTSGPHTHFELTNNSHYLDPLTLLPNLPSLAQAWGDTSDNALSLAPQTNKP